jgi:hypothetical protein
MSILPFALIFILASLPSSIFHSAEGQTPDPQAPRFSLRTLIPYNPSRIGYESLPVKVVGAGGGKLGAREKFKILVSGLRNSTPKNVRAIKISCFIFKFGAWDEVLESRQTSLIPLDLPPFEQRKVEVLVGYVDDIPVLAYKPGQEFHLEVAVTEVHYDDGSIWLATDLPQKLTPAKIH